MKNGSWTVKLDIDAGSTMATSSKRGRVEAVPQRPLLSFELALGCGRGLVL